tara:strand:+ start:2331 stop:2705 length:375 start_codon:yes stop_codon:yes gene_type:complete
MNQDVNKNQSIFFNNIELLCKIGVYEHERKNPQRVIVNLKLILSNEVSPKNDKIDETLNYDIIYRKIKDISSSQHFNLVETLANQIFKYLQSLNKISDLTVSVSKPDIYKDCKEVGYEISSFKN